MRSPALFVCIAPVMLGIGACASEPEAETAVDSQTDASADTMLESDPEGAEGYGQAPGMNDMTGAADAADADSRGAMASGSNSDGARQPDPSRSKLIKADQD